MQPIKNQILFKPFLGDNISSGGIIVPDSFRKLSNKGEIVAVGNKSKRKVGEIGYRVKEHGHEVDIKGEKYFLMEDTAIIALEE